MFFYTMNIFITFENVNKSCTSAGRLFKQGSTQVGAKFLWCALTGGGGGGKSTFCFCFRTSTLRKRWGLVFISFLGMTTTLGLACESTQNTKGLSGYICVSFKNVAKCLLSHDNTLEIWADHQPVKGIFTSNTSPHSSGLCQASV
jgi:hypothetical protein